MSWKKTFAWSRYGRWGLVLLLTAGAIQNGAATADGSYVTMAAAVAVLCGAVLLVRRLPWFLAPALATAATGVWGWPMLPLLLVALFDLAARRRAAVAAGCGIAVLAANTVAPTAVSLWRPQQYGAGLFLLLAIVGGLWMGNRRRLVKALGSEIEHLRVERELREEAARTAERARIAAEMHDVLAHRLSLIALHTGVLATRTDTLPAPVTERLALLRTASTEALTDLRDILGALHAPGTDAAAGAPPAPVLRDVRELVEQARAAGQQVDLHTRGHAEQAPAAHRLALYRLVQEGLTNARKHASGAPVTVRVDHGPPATVVEVTNLPGAPAAHAAPSGYGLVGLRERVRALGGHLSAGPHGVGSWRLAARIPHPAHPEQNGKCP
ncbi:MULTISPECIES: sensor histidine kinase [Streptomyces]|uniref:sensor histidine kinase n=1 Tax=Streptomyces TaxID=1883 RepID=UPI0011F1CCBF|nr:MULTISPECIES: histidine kinase [Streptomyces]QHF95137.1 two-component sensor histidine kinase [Streptomyces sp. NHF165]